MGIFIGNKLSLLVVWLLSNLGAVAGFIVGGSMSLIVMTGMHYTLVPIMVNNISHMGFDPIKIPILCCKFRPSRRGIWCLSKIKKC